MSKIHTLPFNWVSGVIKVIKADSIDAAVEQILGELNESSNGGTRNIDRGGREHVIYFDGWNGLGASAVLRAVAQRLVPGAPEAQGGLHFDQVIHLDCSKWESRRALQRAIAEQLSLPARVMKMIDKQDEEDDFYGVAQASRAEIPQVLAAMNQRIQELNHRFLVIFHNGGSEEVDLSIFGFPLFGYWANKVLWSFQGRFRLKPREKIDNAVKNTGKTDVLLSASRHEKDEEELWSVLVHQEAAEVASMVSTGSSIIQQSQVAGCFLYMLKLCCLGYQLNMDYDMATHCSNYWVCDAIIQQGKGVTGTEYDHGSWQAAEVLQLAMPFDVDNYNHEHPYLLALLHHLAMCEFSRTSAPYWHLQIPSIAIPNAVMFQKFDKLSVLKLSGRIFSLSSPPFLYCHSLKFLWLDHCQDQEINTEGSGTIKEEDIQRCFQRLWVLDVRYTRCDRILSARMLDFMSQLRELNVVGAQDWDIGQLQGRLPNIRKLRVAKSTVSCSSCSEENNLVSGMNKLELFDFSGNRAAMPVVAYISEMSTFSHCLETVIITDGCVGVQKFSFKGCAKLKHLLLSGLFEDLGILDLSRTAVKTLDLSAVTAPNLAQLFLDGCQKLCAILWPPEDKRRSYLQKIHMDTTESAAASESLSEAHGGPVPSELYWCIWVRDARLLRSLVPLESYFYSRSVHMEISSPAIGLLGPAGKNDDEAINSIKRGSKDNSTCTYDDAVYNCKDCTLLQASQGDGDAPTLTRLSPCPSMSSFLDDARDCYMHVQDRGLQESSSEETSTVVTIPEMICRSARILHVHDSLSITSIPGPAPMLSSTWRRLHWCRVERCPELECVFTTPQLQGSSDNYIFFCLKTLWASQLPKARYIWNWSTSTAVAFDLGDRSFEELSLLHLDLCPRIIHVLPLRMPMVKRSLRNLVTLEIVWCGNLEVVFPLYTSSADESRQHQEEQSRITVEFQNLKHIHLHELPKLRSICGHWKISAPVLETVKVRGCWSLKRLPAVSSTKSKKVECDCEKEWWGNLEWGMTANHDPSLYKTIHSPYYKKATLRSSVLN